MLNLHLLIKNLGDYYLGTTLDDVPAEVPSRIEFLCAEKNDSSSSSTTSTERAGQTRENPDRADLELSDEILYIGDAAVSEKKLARLQNQILLQDTIAAVITINSDTKPAAHPESCLLLAERPVSNLEDADAVLFSCPPEVLFNAISRQLADPQLSEMPFDTFWQKIMNRDLVSENEIRRALSQMVYPVKRFLRVCVICLPEQGSLNTGNTMISKPKSANHSNTSILAQLGDIFPQTNMTVSGSDIVLLLSDNDRDYHPTLSEENTRRLYALLEETNAYMIYGNATRVCEALRAVFLLSRRTLDIARQMDHNKGKRILYYEEDCTHCVIDLAVRRYLDEFNNDDIMYLAHPAAVVISRYDRLNGTNYRDILYEYLINDRNLVKTAEVLYMHRNTVLNKVKRALQIIDIDLEDSRVRQRFVFSCQFLKYYENVLHRTIRD